MLFNSQTFILLFLPLTVAGYYLLGGVERSRLWLLSVASLAFYAYWDIRFVPLLLFSVAANWLLSLAYGRYPLKQLVFAGIALNLLIIGVFKYSNFLLENVYAVTDQPFHPWHLVLPLGISFFTFQQISYLVDLRRADAPTYPFYKYLTYVTFFPQLIAGPIVRHNEIVAQFDLPPRRAGYEELIARGAALFVIGLFKKSVLADGLAQTATPLFDAAASGQVLSFAEAWIAASSYALQLYFDFSGYSDMAIGLGLLFGFELPINFDAPYRAVSIRDFWRRWHITLSRFLRDYLYIPLGGSRRGPSQQVMAVVVTMLLGGLWHGAGWTFVLWGGLHGAALAVNHGWQKTGIRLPVLLAWFVTLLVVVVAWVLFRAASVESAVSIYRSMIGMHGLALAADGTPELWLFVLAASAAVLGPTSQQMAYTMLRPTRSMAILVALALVTLTVRLGDAGYSEFIYFQF